MPGHNVNLVAFDLARQHHRRLFGQDPLTPLSGHVLRAVRVQLQFLRDLRIRQVQPQEIEAQNPDAQRLMMPGENRPREVVKLTLAAAALIPLTFRLSVVKTTFRDPPRLTMRALDTPWPRNSRTV